MKELITMQTKRNQESVISAVKNYSKRLFKFIRNSVKNDEDAEDILQDVWYQLSLMVDVESIEQLSSWLFRVSSNRIIDKKRKKKTLSLEDFTYENEAGEIIYPDNLLADFMNPELEFENTEFRAILLNAINELPEKQKQVFVMNEIEDFTLQEIADKTGESIKTIISRKRYAVARLKQSLQDFYNEFNN